MNFEEIKSGKTYYKTSYDYTQKRRGIKKVPTNFIAMRVLSIDPTNKTVLASAGDAPPTLLSASAFRWWITKTEMENYQNI